MSDLVAALIILYVIFFLLILTIVYFMFASAKKFEQSLKGTKWERGEE